MLFGFMFGINADGVYKRANMINADLDHIILLQSKIRGWH